MATVSMVDGRGSLAMMLRNGLVIVAIFLALLLLLWTHQDKTNTALCTQPHKSDDSSQPIQVHVQMPTQNLTQPPLKEAKKGWNYNWDQKAWPRPEDAQGVPMRTIILVRHGQYVLDTGLLNDMGKRQVNITGARLKQLDMKYDRIIHSNLPRAQETAQIIHSHLPHLPMEEDPIIAEGGPIQPDPTVSYWSLPDRAYFIDGPRLEAAFRKYFFRAEKTQQRESIDVLVGHANIFRYLVLRALQLPPEAWMRVFIAHASISLLHINPDGTVTMSRFGDSGHLLPGMITY